MESLIQILKEFFTFVKNCEEEQLTDQRIVVHLFESLFYNARREQKEEFMNFFNQQVKSQALFGTKMPKEIKESIEWMILRTMDYSITSEFKIQRDSVLAAKSASILSKLVPFNHKAPICLLVC